ncbi:MAG: ATPase, partial [Spirochaetaceae bacterium]|nr:ATPase [Spirochaetaceae bacterium]
MARTAKMQFIELLVMKDDISRVIEYLGKQGCFAFQSDSVAQSLNKVHSSAPIDAMHQLDSGFGEEFDHLVEAKEIFQRLQEARAYLNIPEPAGLTASTGLPSERDYRDTRKMISVTEQFKREESELEQAHKRMESAYREALAFSNLQVPYSELDQVSFLSIRIGRVDPERLENLKFAVGEHGAIVALGEDKSRIIAVSSKKGRFSLDTELKKAGFVPIEIAKDFQGIPAEALDRLRQQTAKAQEAFEQVTAARRKFAETHGFIFQHLLCNFSVATQVLAVQENLESTMLVYRITGWVPERDATATVREIDDLAEGRVAIRLYKPDEVPGVQEGVEQVPVKLNHGEFVGSFER